MCVQQALKSVLEQKKRKKRSVRERELPIYFYSLKTRAEKEETDKRKKVDYFLYSSSILFLFYVYKR